MKQEKKISSAFIYFFGAFGGILFGYDIGVMTGALPFLQNAWHLQDSPSLVGWITSAVELGAIFGGAWAGQLADRLGRRKMILNSAVIFAVFALMSAFSPNKGSVYLIIVRILLGLGVGAASALVPAYISELAPANLRGRLSGLNQTMIVSGMLLSYVMDYVLKDLPNDLAWRLMLGFACLPAIILFIGVQKLPESPRYLIKNNKPNQARQVLGYVRSKSEIKGELKEIEKTSSKEHEAENQTKWSDLFKKKYRFLVIAGLGVAAFQQFQGANAIFYYIPLIVERATGKAATSSLIWSVVNGVILVIGSLIYIWIAEKFNRKTLLVSCGTIMGFSFIFPAIINYLFPRVTPWLTIVFLLIYVAFYSFTWAPLTWVLVGELFPLAIRGRASGLASSFNWIGSWVVGLLFPIMAAAMPQEIVFLIFGVICLLGALFVKLRVPETRGRTLEEIEEHETNK